MRTIELTSEDYWGFKAYVESFISDGDVYQKEIEYEFSNGVIAGFKLTIRDYTKFFSGTYDTPPYTYGHWDIELEMLDAVDAEQDEYVTLDLTEKDLNYRVDA